MRSLNKELRTIHVRDVRYSLMVDIRLREFVHYGHNRDSLFNSVGWNTKIEIHRMFDQIMQHIIDQMDVGYAIAQVDL